MIYIIIALVLVLALIIGLYADLIQSYKTLQMNWRWLEEEHRVAGEYITELEGMGSVESYRALDQGMVEITDAYATDMAQYEHTISHIREHLQVQLEETFDRIRRDSQEYTQKMEFPKA